MIDQIEEVLCQCHHELMTAVLQIGGNQRDLAREKNLKKQQEKSKKSDLTEGNKGTSLQERKQR